MTVRILLRKQKVFRGNSNPGGLSVLHDVCRYPVGVLLLQFPGYSNAETVEVDLASFRRGRREGGLDLERSVLVSRGYVTKNREPDFMVPDMRRIVLLSCRSSALGLVHSAAQYSVRCGSPLPVPG
ncbi:hypothetical protein Trydic_g18429 [Trypoxylus dichotomus]